MFDCDTRLHINDYFTIEKPEKYIELRRNDFELETLKIYLNDSLLDSNQYNIVNNIVIFNEFLIPEDKIWAEYRIKHSFYSMIDRKNDITKLFIYTDYENCKIISEEQRKYKVYFETNKRNNKFVATDLSINPIYRTDYKGFIYLTDEHNEPYKINIYCNPTILKAGGYDKVDIQIEVLDIINNPIISKPVAIDCKYGIINCSDYNTDINGVVHFVYESSVLPSIDTIIVRVFYDDKVNLLEKTITITNE